MPATKSRNVDRVTIIASSTAATSAPALQVRDQNFPTGDVLVRSLTIRYDATMGGTSTPVRVTNGHLFWLEGITVETDKHGKLVDAVDGLLMNIFNQLEYRTVPLATALTSTPADTDTPSASWKIPFGLSNGLRPYDTNLDMINARMKVSTQFGIGAAVTNGRLWNQAGGSPVITLLQQSIETKYVQNPVAAGATPELPQYIRCFEQKLDVITATETRRQISIPSGDRIYNRIVISQRNSASKIELATVIVATAEIALYLNGEVIIDRRLFRDIQAENKLTYSLESMPTGVCVLDFDDDTQARINDMLNGFIGQPNMYLYIDVTSVTNGAVLLGFESLKQINSAALRG